jgi:hypothetical protein
MESTIRQIPQKKKISIQRQLSINKQEALNAISFYSLQSPDSLNPEVFEPATQITLANQIRIL